MLLRCLIVVKDPAHARVVKIVGCILLFFRVAGTKYSFKQVTRYDALQAL